jgi:hypothetical protein
MFGDWLYLLDGSLLPLLLPLWLWYKVQEYSNKKAD